jgi:hypothetical protein
LIAFRWHLIAAEKTWTSVCCTLHILIFLFKAAVRVTGWVCEKNRPKCSSAHFCLNYCITSTVGKIRAGSGLKNAGSGWAFAGLGACVVNLCLGLGSGLHA